MSDVIEIEMAMEAYKQKIAKAEALNRLMDNKDFKEVILDSFMGQRRLLDLATKRVSPSFQDPVNKGYVENQISAVGALNMFMMLVEQEAAVAYEALASAEEERAMALEEANA